MRGDLFSYSRFLSEAAMQRPEAILEVAMREASTAC